MFGVEWPSGSENPNTEDGLAGTRILDLCTAGPGPFCTLILAAYGADVIHVARPGKPDLTTDSSHHNSGKRSIRLDLKSDEGRRIIRTLARGADVLIEGFRPGVMERLGFGPDDMMRENSRLIYVRMTGWGQTGPYAMQPGHDINYIGVGGALSLIGGDQPMPPMALLGDYSAGSLMAAINILTALRQRDLTGAGAVLDTNIADGAAMLLHSLVAAKPRQGGVPMRDLLNGTAPFYRTYRCADGKWFSVGAIEPKFYKNLLACLDLQDNPIVDRQYDRKAWLEIGDVLTHTFAQRTRDEWTARLSLHETCAFPVIEPDELPEQPHIAARGTAYRAGGRVHVTRAGRAAGEAITRFPEPCETGAHTDLVLSALGYSAEMIDRLHAQGTVDGPWSGTTEN